MHPNSATRKLLSVCAVLLLVGAGCASVPRPEPVPEAPQPPAREEPVPNPEPEPGSKGVTADGCHRTGCSGQICADEETVSTCEYREEYGCYQGAACERQPDGKCGWTPTESLRLCVEAAGSMEIK